MAKNQRYLFAICSLYRVRISFNPPTGFKILGGGRVKVGVSQIRPPGTWHEGWGVFDTHNPEHTMTFIKEAFLHERKYERSAVGRQIIDTLHGPREIGQIEVVKNVCRLR